MNFKPILSIILFAGILVFFLYGKVENIHAPKISLFVMDQFQGKILPKGEIQVDHHHNIALASAPKVISAQELKITTSSDEGAELRGIAKKSQFVSEKKISSGNTAWTSAFDVEIDSYAVIITIKISLLPSKGVRSLALDESLKTWQYSINSIWNERFYLLDGSIKTPIVFNVRFTHHNPHHRVVVRLGSWVPNQHNWFVDTPASVVAHEIGHMLGAFDEYKGGSLSSEAPLVDTTSIMGSKPHKGVAYPRHLSLLERALAAHLKNEKIKITVNAA